MSFILYPLFVLYNFTALGGIVIKPFENFNHIGLIIIIVKNNVKIRICVVR